VKVKSNNVYLFVYLSTFLLGLIRLSFQRHQKPDECTLGIPKQAQRIYANGNGGPLAYRLLLLEKKRAAG